MKGGEDLQSQQRDAEAGRDGMIDGSCAIVASACI